MPRTSMTSLLPSKRRGAQGRKSCQPAVASYREFRRLADVVNGAVSYFLPLCCCAQQHVVLGSAGWEKFAVCSGTLWADKWDEK